MGKNNKGRKAVTPAPKSIYDITKLVRTGAYEEVSLGYATSGPVLKARAKRFIDQNVVIGNTAFSFNKDGIMTIINSGYVLYDFEVLVKMNGVEEIKDNIDEIKETAIQDKSSQPE